VTRWSTRDDSLRSPATQAEDGRSLAGAHSLARVRGDRVTITAARLGTGLAFPVHPDLVRGDVRYRSGAEKVREAMLLILQTEPGERLMRPTYGCGLRQFLMEPNTVATRARIQREATRALEAFEPRIALRQLTAEPGDDASLVVLTIRYEHRRDGSPGVLVYPFYLEQ
jgi:phage baseplate assembly protein W